MSQPASSVTAPSPASDPAEAPPTFDAIALSPDVRKAVDELGYVHPTPVQRAVFEPASRGGDLVVQARTGTGKTAAFGLPLVDKLVRPGTAAVQALVLSPTRELALQISREVSALGKHRGTKCAAVYGGAPMQRQIDELRGGAQVVIGTPGRVLDHLSRGTLDPSAIRVVILDESDEMLSMGFLPQITEILSRLPAGHQTLLFSATVPPDVRRIAETRLKNPEFITLSGDHIGALSIQHFVYLSQRDKASELVQIIEIENPESAIVFCNTRDQTKRIAFALQQKGYAADWLNADLAQSDREKVMAATRESKLRFLVATDVAARGIDISHLTHVINADFPESTENYVHRTGRTGRAGRTGTAISLITPQDIGNLYMLKLTYKIFPIERELPSKRDQKTRAEADVISMFSEAFAARRPHPDDLSLARRLLTHELAESIVAGLLRDHLGARPEAREQAADARRAKAPRPAEEASEPAPRRREESRRREEPRRDHPRREEPRRDQPRREESRREQPRREERRDEDEIRYEVSDARDERGDEGHGASSERDEDRRKKKKKRKKRHDDERRSDDRAHGEHDRERDAEGADDASPTTRRDELFAEERASGEGMPERPALSAGEVLSQPSGDEDLVRIFVSVGRRDGAHREDFTDILADQGFDENDVVFVKVRDRHTFVGVLRDLETRAIQAFDGTEICGRVAQAERARPRTDDRGAQ